MIPLSLNNYFRKMIDSYPYDYVKFNKNSVIMDAERSSINLK